MVDFEEQLVARLVAAATPAGDRISWFGRQRGDALPALTLMKVSPGEEWTHDGPDGLDEPRVRIDCYAETDVGALALSRAVKAEMRAVAEVDGVRFHEGVLDAERTLDAGEEEGGEPVNRVQLEFLFYVEEIA